MLSIVECILNSELEMATITVEHSGQNKSSNPLKEESL
jgi:hypothetical protein